MFITLYGINNIGKTTQAKRLVDRLIKLGQKAEFIKYPVYDIEPTGSFLNNQLRGGQNQTISEEELQLWFVLNRYQFEPSLKQKLASGMIIIAEDYIGTGLAWGITKGADQTWLETINQHLLKENLAILLTGQRQIKAKEAGHIHESADDLMEKCSQIYLELAKKYNWKIVEIEDDWDKTTEKIWEIVKNKLNK